MRSILFLIASCLAAATIPFFQPDRSTLQEFDTAPKWPTDYLTESHKVEELTKREKRFYNNFPGKIIKFSDGRTDLVIKWVLKPTRKLHPASDCYKGYGYKVTPEPVLQDEKEKRWSTFTATRDKSKVLVKERIYNNSGQNWTDVSGWFWSALFNKSKGPWWVVTISESG